MRPTKRQKVGDQRTDGRKDEAKKDVGHRRVPVWSGAKPKRQAAGPQKLTLRRVPSRVPIGARAEKGSEQRPRVAVNLQPHQDGKARSAEHGRSAVSLRPASVELRPAAVEHGRSPVSLRPASVDLRPRPAATMAAVLTPASGAFSGGEGRSGMGVSLKPASHSQRQSSVRLVGANRF